VGKTEDEIKDAIQYGILLFNVESAPELELINKVAGILNTKADVCLRLNPNVSAPTHHYIRTAEEESKFGLDLEAAEDLFLRKNNFKNVNIVGVHLHIGSQITEAKPFQEALKIISDFIKRLQNEYDIELKWLNIGGGLGIIYNKEKPQTAEEFAKNILALLKETKLKIILEPGRFIVGNAGILVTKVIYIKETPKKRFIIVDAAMNDLIRPALYGAYHEIIPVRFPISFSKSHDKKADVVGPVCESADFLGKDRDLSNIKSGNLLAVMGAGAYGFSMSSNYNSRRRPAEVMVRNNKVFILRKQETYQDLVKGEKII
jgi:diaminopimelate decarboxylase